MYPDFSYILHAIFGTDPDNFTSIIKTFGLFLGFAFLASAWAFSVELKRKEKLGQIHAWEEKGWTVPLIKLQDALIQSAISFFIGFKIFYISQHFEDFKIDPAAIIFSGKGNLLGGMLFGLGSAVYYYFQYQKQQKDPPKEITLRVHPYQRVGDITIVAAISGIVGSKLFSIFENFGDFLRDPMGQFFSGSGLTIYGGLILASFVVLRYVKRLGMSQIYIADAGAPAMIMGYAVGRMGCQFSGDGDWGIPNPHPKPDWFFLPDSFWANSYPHNVVEEGSKMADCVWRYCNALDQPVYPTPLYEILLGFLIFGVLWKLRHRIKTPGVLFFIYCILNGVERFFIEFIRVNPRYDILGMQLSLSQGVAILFVLTGLIGIYFCKKYYADHPSEMYA